MVLTNAEKQKRYRAKKSNAPDSPKVTVSPESNVQVVETVTESARNVTENPILSESSRESKISTPATPTPDSGSETRIASIEDYHAHREDYAERACVELLNWGPWMNAAELSDARLSGNRVSEPGDWDYVGTCS